MSTSLPADFRPVRVGHGHGFVVAGGPPWHCRYVITAAHCLPTLPPPEAALAYEEYTYFKLLGRFRGKRTVAAEMVFVDPIADLAVLGTPDSQELPAKARAYENLVEAAVALPIADLPVKYHSNMPVISASNGWLFSLATQEWFSCQVLQNGGRLSLREMAEPVVGGMSGSPILTDDGAAIGIIVRGRNDPERPDSILNPRLAGDLPGRLLRDLGRA